MLDEKANTILQLVHKGRVNDLLALMEGDSPYTTDASEGAPRDNELGRLWIGALYHLRFIAEFGVASSPQIKNGRVESSFPEIFTQWLEMGALGIASSDLSDYLRDNPI